MIMDRNDVSRFRQGECQTRVDIRKVIRIMDINEFKVDLSCSSIVFIINNNFQYFLPKICFLVFNTKSVFNSVGFYQISIARNVK